MLRPRWSSCLLRRRHRRRGGRILVLRRELLLPLEVLMAVRLARHPRLTRADAEDRDEPPEQTSNDRNARENDGGSCLRGGLKMRPSRGRSAAGPESRSGARPKVRPEKRALRAGTCTRECGALELELIWVAKRSRRAQPDRLATPRNQLQHQHRSQKRSLPSTSEARAPNAFERPALRTPPCPKGADPADTPKSCFARWSPPRARSVRRLRCFSESTARCARRLENKGHLRPSRESWDTASPNAGPKQVSHGTSVPSTRGGPSHRLLLARSVGRIASTRRPTTEDIWACPSGLTTHDGASVHISVETVILWRADARMQPTGRCRIRWGSTINQCCPPCQLVLLK